MSEIIGNGIFVDCKNPILVTKTINANGTYDAEDDNADGYSSVVVNVSGGGSVAYPAVRVWTKDAADYNANLYIQTGRVENGTFIGDSDSVILAYTGAATAIEYGGLVSVQYLEASGGGPNWRVKAIDDVVYNSVEYSAGDTLATWPYNQTVDILAWSKNDTGGDRKDITYLPSSDSSKILCSMDVNIASNLVVIVDSGTGIGEMGVKFINSLPVENGAIKLQGIGIHVPLSSGSANSTSYLVSRRNTGDNEIFIHSRNGDGGWPFFNNRSNAQYAVYNSSNTEISGISAYDWHLYAMSIDMTNKIVRFFCDGEFLGQRNFSTSVEINNTAISFNSKDRAVANNYGCGDLSVKYMGVVEDFESDATVIANMQTIMSKLGLTA